MRDPYGLPLGTGSARAAESFAEALHRLLLGQWGSLDGFERAIAADDGFALAHLGRAMALQELGRNAEAAGARGLAQSLSDRGGTRERHLIQGIVTLLDVDGQRGIALLDEHLSEFPRDVLALEQLTGFLFFHGGVGKKARVIGLLDRVASAFEPGDPYLGSRRAFHLQEVGRLAESRAEAERVLTREPRSATAAHALAHVLSLEGAATQGAAFLEDWLPGYACGGRLHGHLWWHVALFALELGHAEEAAAHYRGHMRPGGAGPRHLILADAAGLLWRMDLYGVPVAAECWADVRELAHQFLASPGRPFTALHSALVLAALDDPALDDLLRSVSERARTGDRLAAGVTLPIAEGIRAFRRGDYASAIDRLASVPAGEREGAGGSDIERDVFEQTLIEAYLRAGRFAEAATRVSTRLGRAPSPREHFWLGRAELGRGDSARGAAALAAAKAGWAGADPALPEGALLERLLAGLSTH